MNKKTIMVASAVIVGAGLFFGGMAYGRSTAGPSGGGNFGGRQANFVQFSGGAGGRTGGPNGGQAGFVSGEVLSQDASGITVKMRDGSSKIVIIAGSTEITKSVSGTAKDVGVGQNVMVAGTPNSDGSITAQSVQIRPEMPTAPKAI